MILQTPFRACFAYIVAVVCVFDTLLTIGQNRVFIGQDKDNSEARDSYDFIEKALKEPHSLLIAVVKQVRGNILPLQTDFAFKN
jgi:hypothetical protein